MPGKLISGLKQSMKGLRVSAPGRICLFGEHQDYLKLPVITAAINLRLVVSGSTQKKRQILINLPDISAREIIPLPSGAQEIPYERERDYFRSMLNVLLRRGLQLETGYRCEVQGNIPINSGTSSSSAMIIAWAGFLIEHSRELKTKFPDSADLAQLGYLAEVVEFGEPGGMMDHYATAIGGILFIDFAETVRYEILQNRPGSFVLGDSLEPKDTKEILARVKYTVLQAVEKIQQVDPAFNLYDGSAADVERFNNLLVPAQIEVLRGALMNRDITREAKKCFQAREFDHYEFGRLLTRHQEILNRDLKISTPKIERMLSAASRAGALGGKINGSGGGGCMFAYTPENPQKVAMAIEAAGGKAYIINVDDGMRVEHL
jgi:galactokinase